MRKKLAMLMASLFLVLGTAWADISTTWTPTTPWVKTGFTAPEGVTTLANGKSVAMLEVPVRVTAEQVTVSFTWSGNSCALNMLGVDLVNRATEEVVQSHYASLKTGGDRNTITYTLSGLTPGDKFALRYFSWYASNEKLHESEGNIAIVGAVESAYIPGKVYQLKNQHDSYYVYESTGDKKLKPKHPNSVDTDEDGSIHSDNYDQLWVLGKSAETGKFTLRNAETKRYMTPGGEWSTSESVQGLYVLERTQATGTTSSFFNISSVVDATGRTNLHCWASTSVAINWDGDGGGSQFAFVEVTSVTVASLATLAIKDELNPLITEANDLKYNTILTGTTELTALSTALTKANGLTSSQDWDAVLAAVDALATAIANAEKYIEDHPVEEFEPTDLYALKSPTGTYLNFTAVVPEPGAATTYASFQDEPSFLYKVAENNSYYFESMSTPGEYIGVGPSNVYWIVAKDNKALWNISSEDANGYVTISRSANANYRLGHDEYTNKGTGIFSNVGANCNKWQLIPAYPITIIYKNSNDEVLETVKAGVFVGESYTIDTKGQTVKSCITDKGTIQENGSVYTIPAVNGATTVTVTFAEVDKYMGSKPTITDDEISTLKNYGQYLTNLKLGDTSILSGAGEPSSASDMHVQILGKSVDVVQGTEYTFTLTFPKNQTSQALVARVWMDKDGDGTYESLLSTTGVAEKYTDLTTVKFAVPYDATPGVTRIRLRLDGAWAISETANGATKRMVYDIEVNVVEAPKTDITYNLIYKGQTIATENIRAIIGANFPVPTTEFKIDTQYLSFALPEGTVGENPATYDVEVTVIAKGFPIPTTITDGEFADNTQWYLATLRKKYIKYNGSTEVVATTDKVFSDAHLFALTGDPVNGFQFYNKELGTDRAIYSNNPVNMSNDNPTPVELTESPDGTWMVTSNSHGGFSFVIENNSTNYYLHEKKDKLTFWENSNAKTDEGSSLIFKEAYDFTFFITGVPEGEDAGATFSGNSIVNGSKVVETEYLSKDLFNANDIEGYAWSVTVDKKAKAITLAYQQPVVEENPEAVVALVNRIGGAGTAEKFKFVLDPSINSRQETFILGNDEGKILIKGSTLSAITTGLGWYLNNIAHINIAWNSLNEKTVSGDAYVDLANIELPLPTAETHTSDAKYRYYLNYCTFGYSMTSWTWKRWQQEIDWMALHGVNMPLQIVGLEEVWRQFLTMPKYNYSAEEAKAFIPGPAYTAWWGMNNLEGWGGTGADGWGGVQDDAWYKRQQALATQILSRQRELGMQPVLPGFSGMVPSNFNNHNSDVTTDVNGSGWQSFTRPHIIDPDEERFAEIAADYYACLHAVMGKSQYYSMDPFHEDGVLSNNGTTERYAKGYRNIYDAMETANPGSQWVIQQWHWKWYQKVSTTAVPDGRLIVLDLFSDGSPAFDSYNGYAPQDAVFCAIPNFGGRSGLMGRLQNVTNNYFSYKAQYNTIKGIGTAPEAIEQTPVTYDLIYQLPWIGGKPNDVGEWVRSWVANYSVARYGKDNAEVKEAWNLLRQSVLAYGADGIEGPIEDVWAARPNLEALPASKWGKTMSVAIDTYTKERHQMLIDAVYKLIDQQEELALQVGSVYESNYLYDLVEFGGGVMADYAYYLLKGIAEAKGANDDLYQARKNAFLQLISDMDAFRGTNLNFRLGKWTQEARDAAKEVDGWSTETQDWYEFNNARTLITTWTYKAHGLNDYSYRSWQGLLKDVYLPRWEYFFNNGCTHPNGSRDNYFYFEWNWAHGKEHHVGQTAKSDTKLTEGDKGYSYSREPVGNTVDSAKAMLQKYIIPIKYNDGTTYYAYRTFTTDLTGKVTINVAAGSTVDFTQYFDVPADAVVTGNFINNNEQSANIKEVPVVATGESLTGRVTLADGTALSNFSVTLAQFYGYYHISWSEKPLFIGYNEVQDEWLNEEQTNKDYVNNEGYKGYKILGGGYTTNAEADKVFAIVPKDGGYIISAQGKYLQSPEFNTWRHIQFANDKDAAGVYLFHETNDAFKIQGVGENETDETDPNHWTHNDYLQVYGGTIVGPNPEGSASSFTITPAEIYTVTLSDKGFLPLCLPFNVVLPEGVVACDINDLSKEKLMMGSEGLFTTIATTGQIVKAGTPMILKGTASASYALGITLNNNGAKTSLAGSVLRGNYVKQTLQPTDEVKMFVLTGEEFNAVSGSYEIPANSCWIEADIEDDDIDLEPEFIEIDDWKFKVKKEGKGITITDCVVHGSGHLNIGSHYEVEGSLEEVIAISDDFLHDNLDLIEVTLPATLTSVGKNYANYMFQINYQGADEGAGTGIGVPKDNSQNAYKESEAEAEAWEGVLHDCRYKVLGESTWRMTVKIDLTNFVSHFNDFGSCILATKKNTLSNNYSDGSMQLYLRTDKGIVLKLDQEGDTYMFNNPQKGSQYTGTSFTFVLENDGAGAYTAKMIYGSGEEESFYIIAADHAELHSFNTIWSSLGEGISVNVRFDKLTNRGLFVGCKNLTHIHVHGDNPSFSGCEHGVLYNKAKTHVIRFPEGGGDIIPDCTFEKDGHRHFELPRSVTRVYAGALHDVNAHIIFHSNPLIMHVDGHEGHMIAKYYLRLEDDAESVDLASNMNTFQDIKYMREVQKVKRIDDEDKKMYYSVILPFKPAAEDLAPYEFYRFSRADEQGIDFSEVVADEVEAHVPYLFAVRGDYEYDTFTTEITAGADPHTLGWHNDTVVVKHDDWVVVGCYSNEVINVTTGKNANYYFYGVSSATNKLVRVTNSIKTKPYRMFFVNTRPVNSNGVALARQLNLRLINGSTTEITPEQIDGWGETEPIYYDLQGRRVLNPENGIYIVNGKKVVL